MDFSEHTVGTSLVHTNPAPCCTAFFTPRSVIQLCTLLTTRVCVWQPPLSLPQTGFTATRPALGLDVAHGAHPRPPTTTPPQAKPTKHTAGEIAAKTHAATVNKGGGAEGLKVRGGRRGVFYLLLSASPLRSSCKGHPIRADEGHPMPSHARR